MPVPPDYRRASDDFLKFLVDARDAASLQTTHQAYTMVQGVLQVFRRRLDVKEAILFAGILPPFLRALFVADWDVNEPRRDFGDSGTMNEEVRRLRPDHNPAPADAIRHVAAALRKNMDEATLEVTLRKLPAGAAVFWRAGA